MGTVFLITGVLALVASMLPWIFVAGFLYLTLQFVGGS